MVTHMVWTFSAEVNKKVGRTALHAATGSAKAFALRIPPLDITLVMRGKKAVTQSA